MKEKDENFYNTVKSSKERYVIVEGSTSGHCCFEFTIVDRDVEEKNGDNVFISFKPVCECFYKEHAELVAESLNATQNLKNILSWAKEVIALGDEPSVTYPEDADRLRTYKEALKNYQEEIQKS